MNTFFPLSLRRLSATTTSVRRALCDHANTIVKAAGTTTITSNHLWVSSTTPDCRRRCSATVRTFASASVPPPGTSTRSPVLSTDNNDNNNNKNVLPAEEYYEGHLMADHLEYLDDMLERTMTMENQIEDLRTTSARKKEYLYQNIDWMLPDEIDALFAKSENQKQTIQQQLGALKEKMQQQQQKQQQLPSEEYYDGHLVFDRLEYMDDMMDRTIQIESHVDDLKEQLLEKRNFLYNNVNWMASAEIDELFRQSEAQKVALREQLTALKELMFEARTMYGIDAPDGTPDGFVLQEMKAVNEIIDFASTHEDKDAIEAQHLVELQEQNDAKKVTAVDGPDGMPDVFYDDQIKSA